MKQLHHRESNGAALNFTRSSVLTQVNGGDYSDREFSDKRNVVTVYNVTESHCVTPLSHIVSRHVISFSSWEVIYLHG